jgi:hypothetical protein
MRVRVLVLAAALATAPLGAQAADLVVWWDQGYYPEEREAVEETVAAFEQETGNQVELVFHPESEHPEAIAAALEAGQPPDFAFGLLFSGYVGQWAFDDRLVDLTGAIATFRTCLIRMRSPGRRGATPKPAKKPYTGCRWAGRFTTLTHGRASSSARASPSPTFRRSGTLSGRSGAIRCSQRCAWPLVATTSGASGRPWRPA